MSHLVVPVTAEDHHQGRLDAPLVLVEYGDFECPFCGRMYPIIQRLQQALGDRLCVVYRHFPLVDMHPHAGAAALMSEAAAAAGKFWPMHDRLFEHQDALDDDDLARYAQDLGVPQDLVERAFGGAFARKVRADFAGGVRSGVNGTPALYLNGTRYDGEPDDVPLLETLEQMSGKR
ncbi:DsbA family protein [Cupriavidus agavae]|uniref:Protein-disulfide isomerase n=1 Tax=Cupriavidus agavae TaxID=1001822 RepID=A0A4Q7S7Y7_9BURK|nr:DsbA family protein [Cupriavidus agavae]RZT42495.1 protein-disulfide isomerase [Cupriavidus agavae]